MKKAILLIDDKQEQLDGLANELNKLLDPDQTNVLTWAPSSSDRPMEVFPRYLETHDVRLVVTDYDLTEQGQLGFFGATVVDWCQARAIPVGDFSRGNASSLAKEPNLFELRVPVESFAIAAKFISEVYGGFVVIRSAIDTNDSLLNQKSPAAALANLLDAKGMAAQFSQYGIRYGSANSALVDRVAETASPTVAPNLEDKAGLLTYIMGHLLVNAVLRFPGPILSKRALAAYLAVSTSEHERYAECFNAARYIGPFSSLGNFFWTEKIDAILADVEGSLSGQQEFGSPGEKNRCLLEALLNTTLQRDTKCDRCDGTNGGFLCPFTDRTVCQRADCSVVSNIWIPAGARLSRFERGFYDEWAPILGM